jgi:DUF4097 and DUF4098 domain-containing protein YvlB
MIATVIAALGLLLTPGLPVPAGGDGAPVTATLAVTGPVTVSLKTVAADVEVATGPAGKITLTVTDSGAKKVALVPGGGDRVDAEFDGRSKLHSGRVRLVLPPGGSVDVKTVSGEIATAITGEVRARTMSGSVKARGAATLDVTAVTGDVTATEIGRAARVKTVSGNAFVSTSNAPGAQVELETVDGEVRLNGSCGPKGRVDVKTVSGEVLLLLDPRASSFDLKFQSSTGDLRDDLGMTVRQQTRRPMHAAVEARYGKGDGVIEVRSFSGDLAVKKR